MEERLSLERIRNWQKLPMHTATYASRALGREQVYGWMAPEAWDGVLNADTLRYPVLLLLHGRDGNFRDWYANTRVGKYALGFPMVVVFVEGGNGWYTNGVREGAERYEDDLLQDLIPHLCATLPVLATGRGWGIGGLSMGGYGAMKLALKHPNLFSLAISHSGSLEKPMISEPHPVFGDPEADLGFRRRESLPYLVEQMLCLFPVTRPHLFFDCGLSDPLLECNRRFRDHLQFLGYGHEYAEMPGHHTFPYWDRALRAVFPAIARHLGAVPREDLLG